jgi:putative SOS response-associated peptidase YedK
MCGRISQARSEAAYAQAIGWPDHAADSAAPHHPNWNVAPGTTPLLMHAFDEDRPGFARVGWGYRPTWAIEKRIPLAINARIEKAATGAFFRPLWKHGRCVVPADGWYEWTGEKGHKQPWYIRLRADAPMFLAALTDFRPDRPSEDAGFVIVTAAADAGMVDVHDRRPVVFAPQDAALWMDNSLPPEQAEQLARAMTRPAGDFEWYPVSREVNKAGHNGAHLIEPVA